MQMKMKLNLLLEVKAGIMILWPYEKLLSKHKKLKKEKNEMDDKYKDKLSEKEVIISSLIEQIKNKGKKEFKYDYKFQNKRHLYKKKEAYILNYLKSFPKSIIEIYNDLDDISGEIKNKLDYLLSHGYTPIIHKLYQLTIIHPK